MAHASRSNLSAADPDHPAAHVLADVVEEFVGLPSLLQYELAIGPAIRLAASGPELNAAGLDLLVDSCWRSVYRG